MLYEVITVTLQHNRIDSRDGASQGVSMTGPYNTLQFLNNTFQFDDDGEDAALTFNPESTDATASNALIALAAPQPQGCPRLTAQAKPGAFVPDS